MFFLYIIFVALNVFTSAESPEPCRFANGTAIPTGVEWEKFAPCPQSSICCALNRGNAPGGNQTLGSTRDECLPNGLCQNRATRDDGSTKTQWWVNYCTESDWYGGKCMDICPAGKTKVSSCDGTATSKRWCCGESTDCCSTNVGVVTLKQVFAGASSRPYSLSLVATTTSSATAAATSTPASGSGRFNGDVIAAAVAGAIIGLSILFAAFCVARRRSRKRRVADSVPDMRVGEDREVEERLKAEADGMAQRHELGPSANQASAQELPGMPPMELPGDAERR